jgi:hypothetical protein
MFLHISPLLAEAPGSQEQLDRTLRSAEEKKARLEEDITAYIRQKQEELREYEQQVSSTVNRSRMLVCS